MRGSDFLLSLIIALCALLIVVSCVPGDETNSQDFIITEKDLIPEGIAFDTATETIYVSSTYKRKIICIDKNGKVSDFISEGQEDIKSVIGMEVDSRTNSLWVVSSEAKEVLPLKQPGTRQWWSSVYQFNLASGKLIKKYFLKKDSIFLNDITVGKEGTVYVTESVQNAVYKISPGEDSLQLFVKLKPYSFINGICFAGKPGWLFTSSTEGIISINLATKEYSLIAAAANVNPGDIDGLSFADNYFIGHQSTKVCRFYLTTPGDSINRSDTLSYGKEFDGSTTGEIGNGSYYFIVNSQIQSGIDYKKQEIKPTDSLENIIIRKQKLKP